MSPPLPTGDGSFEPPPPSAGFSGCFFAAVPLAHLPLAALGCPPLLRPVAQGAVLGFPPSPGTCGSGPSFSVAFPSVFLKVLRGENEARRLVLLFTGLVHVLGKGGKSDEKAQKSILSFILLCQPLLSRKSGLHKSWSHFESNHFYENRAFVPVFYLPIITLPVPVIRSVMLCINMHPYPIAHMYLISPPHASASVSRPPPCGASTVNP